MSELIAWLDDREAAGRRIGGKGAGLARLSAAGFPVPPGFVVTAEAYESFADAHGLGALTEPLAGLSATTPLSEIREALVPVSERLQGAALDETARAAVSGAYAELEDRTTPQATFAVRSSGLNEDGAGNSFAGLYESFINLRGDEAILAAVLDCYRCVWDERAAHYRTFRGIAHAGEAMAVVVMEVVPAKASGVAFTKNPVTGASDEVFINASWGLGEAVVSGYVTPDSFIVGIDGTLIEKAIAEKHEWAALVPGGTERAPTPPELLAAASLSDAQALAVAEAARAVEREYGSPVDIEFAYDDADRFYLLQARPITT